MGITHALVGQIPPNTLVEPLEIDMFWMRHALLLAEEAEARSEVPVGALLVYDGQCIAAASNSSIADNDPTAHAEILALRMAGLKLNNYRLLQSILYVTLEPCPMCAGAMVHARVSRLVYAARDPRTGSSGDEGSAFNLLQTTQLNHRCEVTGGVLAEESALLLRRFFQAKRTKLPS